MHCTNDFFRNCWVLLSLLVFLNGSCSLKHHRYKKGRCVCEKEKSNPFQLDVTLKNWSLDTLELQFQITNQSDTTQLLYSGYMHQGFLVENDTTLTINRTVVRTFFREIDNKKINCKNCLEYYKKDSRFLSLHMNQSYSFSVKETVLGLKRKFKGDVISVSAYISISPEINRYCPFIWTGSISRDKQIELK